MYASKYPHIAKAKQTSPSTSPSTVSQKLIACVCENKLEYLKTCTLRSKAG